jgi:SAM-dependent methyltransferase
MQQPGDVFRSGKYHTSFKQKHNHIVRQAQLRLFYRTSARYIDKLGWASPLAHDTPHILLCGTASPYTTATFIRFVRGYNRKAAIDVLDIAPLALRQSQEFLATCQDIDRARITFIEGDALSMPCADEQYDWIETDFLIQFFPAEEKANLFREWYRVLKPGGIVTTRDWLLHRENLAERVIERTKNWFIRHMLGPVACSARLQEMQTTLQALGFEVALYHVKIPFIKVRVPMMYYILLQKL